MIDSVDVVPVLDADAHPDVGRPYQISCHLFQTLGTFGQHLKRVLWTLAHDIEDLLDVVERNVLVEQVRHAIHEDQTPLLPPLG
jgi:hypothetical protein